MTKAVREAFEHAFGLLQKSETANLVTWAEKNPTEFYKLASRLIPALIDANVQGNLTVVTGVPPAAESLV